MAAVPKAIQIVKIKLPSDELTPKEIKAASSDLVEDLLAAVRFCQAGELAEWSPTCASGRPAYALHGQNVVEALQRTIKFSCDIEPGRRPSHILVLTRAGLPMAEAYKCRDGGLTLQKINSTKFDWTRCIAVVELADNPPDEWIAAAAAYVIRRVNAEAGQ